MTAVPLATLTLRSWLRYILPLTGLAIVAFAVVAIALGLASGCARIADELSLASLFAEVPPKAAVDAAAIHTQLRAAWILAGTAWILQLALAGAAIPAVRAVAGNAALGQRRAIRAGLTGLSRAVVPCLVAVLAIAIGGVALVVPGLALLVLLALTGAAAEGGAALPAPLVDSIAVARTELRTVAIVVAGMLVLDLAIAYGAQLAIVHAVPKPNAQTLANAHAFVRVVAVVLVAISALPACALAAVYTRRR
jgi:hypothetical protein